MAGEENLVPLTTEKAREIGALGGKASGEAKRRKKLLRDALELLLEKEYEGKDGEKAQGVELMATIAMKQAIKGDWKAWELVRDTSGQKPVDRMITAEVDADVIDEIEDYIRESKGRA